MRLAGSTALAAVLLIMPAQGIAQTAKTPAGKDFVTIQPAGEFLASLFIGQLVTNSAGEVIGNINDLLLDKSGRITSVVVGVGGFLGIGEKNVAFPFGSLSVTADANGKRVLSAPFSKTALEAAPEFKATEKTIYMRAKEQAEELGQKAADKARELKNEADRKIEEMNRPKAN
jgi:hypothetical protein